MTQRGRPSAKLHGRSTVTSITEPTGGRITHSISRGSPVFKWVVNQYKGNVEGLVADSFIIGLVGWIAVMQHDQIVEGFGLFVLDIAWLYARIVG